MKKWKHFEQECTDYLNFKYGNYFIQVGNSDATVSDILFIKKSKFYIEAKMRKAQSGQFVVFPDVKTKSFLYSCKNKTNKNIYTNQIIDFMNKDFDLFSQVSTDGIEINMQKSVFYDWIKSFYKEKDVKFIISKDYDNQFIIFPISDLDLYFDVSAKYRIKKSGSSGLNESNKSDFESAMKREGIPFNFLGLNIESKKNIEGRYVKGDKYEYLLRKNGNNYDVRKLSNTKNANVIFSIELKNKKFESLEKSELQFKKEIKKILK